MTSVDGITVNFLVVILYFLNCYHWGKLSERYTGSLCITSYNCL